MRTNCLPDAPVLRSTPAVALTLFALSVLGAGCSSEAEAPDRSALRSAFPDQAAAVLERGTGFSAGGDRFAPIAPSPGGGGHFMRLEVELPARASDFIRLRTAGGFEVRVRELGARGEGVLVEKTVAYPREGGAAYWTASAGGVEEWLHLNGTRGKKRVEWEIDGASLEQRGELVAVVDEAGAARVWISAPSAFAKGGRPIQPKLTAAGKRLELSVDTDAEEVLVDPIWTAAAPMGTARKGHRAVLLADGTVLMVGGDNFNNLASAEIFDPSTQQFTAAVNTMQSARQDPTATRLSDGKVLVAGGRDVSAVATADLYNPATKTFSSTGSMVEARRDHIAVRLGDGKVLVAGGIEGGNAKSDAEIYNPATQTWASTAGMASVRGLHTATLLGDGKVLVAGGATDDLPFMVAYASCEIYNPSTGTWSAAGSMLGARGAHIAVALANGKVLVAGGANTAGPIATAELYDPTTNTWSQAAPMSVSRNQAAAALLSNGTVLVAGGTDGVALHVTAEVYDPGTNQWAAAGSMSQSHSDAAGALLADGSFLIAGGTSGSTAHAVADIFVSGPCPQNGASCDDGDPCTQTDTCQGGACVGANPKSCPAPDACNSAACDPGTGQCVTSAVADGTACDDGDQCTQSDTCQTGACAGASPVQCAPLDQCHDAGACDPATGLCSNPAKGDDEACDDGDACTQADTCQSGACEGAIPVTCAALDQCHVPGVCDPVTGACSNPPVADGTACNDGDACSKIDTCQSGACVGASPIQCVAFDQCHVAGMCDPATGLCSNPNKANGLACDDKNFCTLTDTCQSGACIGSKPKVCSAPNACNDAACDPGTGQCLAIPKGDGTACNDGDQCTQIDACQSGACVGASPVQCSALDQCHAAGACNPATGICSNLPVPNNSPCDDMNACTQADTCQAGACVGTSPKKCVALDQCHNPGTCDPATGICSNPEEANGAACSDGNACTTNDTCQAGACVSGSSIQCAVPDQCHTQGTCNPATGVCSNPPKPDGLACDDANACTQTDTCQAGTCVGADPKDCVALDQCHDPGTCDPDTGECSNPVEPEGAACSDENACTVNDTCQAGACVPGAPKTCAALDQCHNPGTCDPDTGECSNPVEAEGAVCSDGNACTVNDTCQAGACVPGAPKTCDALDQCHDPGTCDPGTGECSNPVEAEGAACSDGNACTVNDTCQAGGCVSGTPKTCAALDQCHEPGTCDTATGQCSNPQKPDSTACDDNNACTLGDECTNGKCGGEAIICPPLDACHPGVCDKSSGKCSYSEIPSCSLPGSEPPPPPPVSAFKPCTSAAECDTGFCVDGVCCNTACQEICHTCVQPSAIGTCLPSPLGSDLRHDCGNPGDCVKTCGGPENPACVDAIPGTECLPSECLDDGLHGLGPAFCPAPGAKCAINDRVPFDCAPYRCIKQSGQCGLQCASSDDCALPFVCDPEHRCVPPPPVASGQPSTCASSPGPSASDAGGVAPLFAALAVALFRRRRRPASLQDR